MPLTDRPVLDILLGRLEKARKAHDIVVTTSLDANDDEIAQFSQNRGISLFRGSEADTVDRIFQAAKQAKEYGCAAICCVPPIFFRTTDRARIDHYKAVADAADGLPFFVYNLPQLTQVETVPALMEKFMAAVPTIVGLKHSAVNFADIRAFADMGLKCFSGNGALPLPALTMGAVGTVDAPLSIAPWHYAELFAAWERGDMARAQELQDGVGAIVDVVRMFEAPADVTKAILSERLGIDCGRSIPPVNRLTDEERAEVVKVARERGFTKQHAAAGV